MFQRSRPRLRAVTWGIIGGAIFLGLLVLEAHALRDVVVIIETY